MLVQKFQNGLLSVLFNNPSNKYATAIETDSIILLKFLSTL